ncbi:MAG: orotidine-5'-phosphate decarboxylase [Tissierellia bacterium]|nr:orotidine-5'-phosphate decarboxylase [Tissierellia bacterium]
MMDQLVREVRNKSCVCVGLDSHLDYVPPSMKKGNPSEILFNYNKAIIDATADLVAVFKLQIAYYEALGLEGLKAYKDTLIYLKQQGLLSIGDIKRGDIAATAKEYARAHFQGDFEADFITLSPYMGLDSTTPYLPYLEKGKGVFVLLRTSNPGSRDLQSLEYNGESLFYHLGDLLKNLSRDYIGTEGYSNLSLVVGGTHKDEAQKIRTRYNDQFFLIPGYGAQGGTASDVKLYLNQGNGGVVNSSRGIITAYKNFEDGEERFSHYTREAVKQMVRDIHGSL